MNYSLVNSTLSPENIQEKIHHLHPAKRTEGRIMADSKPSLKEID